MKKTIVLFIRHGAHGGKGVPKNCLTDAAREQAVTHGLDMTRDEDWPVNKLDVAIASPQPRAVETLLCFMRGMGAMTPVMTDIRFGGLMLDPDFGEETLNKLFTDAKAAEMEPERFYITSPTMRDICVARAEKNAEAMRALVREHEGKTIGIASHSGSMESMVAVLMGRDAQAPVFFFNTGDCVVMEFENGNYKRARFVLFSRDQRTINYT